MDGRKQSSLFPRVSHQPLDQEVRNWGHEVGNLQVGKPVVASILNPQPESSVFHCRDWGTGREKAPGTSP